MTFVSKEGSNFVNFQRERGTLHNSEPEIRQISSCAEGNSKRAIEEYYIPLLRIPEIALTILLLSLDTGKCVSLSNFLKVAKYIICGMQVTIFDNLSM